MLGNAWEKKNEIWVCPVSAKAGCMAKQTFCIPQNNIAIPVGNWISQADTHSVFLFSYQLLGTVPIL